MKAIAILIGVSILVVAGACLAGENPGYILDDKAAQVNASVKMALHLVPHGTAGCGAKVIPVIPTFESIIRTQSSYTDVDAFMVIFDYDSISVYEYTLYWPTAWGSGSTVTCLGSVGLVNLVNSGDPGVTMTFPCVVSGGNGAAYLPVAYTWLLPTSDGQIEIGARIETQNTVVVDCRSDSDPSKGKQYVSAVYFAGVNVDPYEGPPIYETQPTSWGSIKSLFR